MDQRSREIREEIDEQIAEIRVIDRRPHEGCRSGTVLAIVAWALPLSEQDPARPIGVRVRWDPPAVGWPPSIESPVSIKDLDPA